MPKKKPLKGLNDIVDMLVDKAYQFWEWKLINATQETRTFETEPEGLPKGYYKGFDHAEMDSVIDIVTPLLASAQQTRKVEAQTSKDIVKLVKTGKISIDDATKLMTLTKVKLDVEEKEFKKELQVKMLKVFEDDDEEKEEETNGTEKS